MIRKRCLDLYRLHKELGFDVETERVDISDSGTNCIQTSEERRCSGVDWSTTSSIRHRRYSQLLGWLCLTSHRQRGHLETAPPFTVPCKGREAR